VSTIDPRVAEALAGRYRLERQLGVGGMATVWLAEDVRHRRRVAVKVLRSDLSMVLGAERFLREVEIAANLTHPHILTLIDSGEIHLGDDGRKALYYVMPFVDGESLRARLTRERELPIPDAVHILREIVDALAYAHAHNVVHRDVKPENVMLTGRHALMVDFGVAKAVADSQNPEPGDSSSSYPSLTSAGMAVGTPAYMSPEQAVAAPDVDARSDIYSIGVMAYEMLTGEQPFRAATPQQVLAAQITEKPEPVNKRRPNLPQPLADLVMRCLEKRPADRPQHAAELLPVFDSIVTPGGGTTPPQLVPIRQRRTPLIALVVALGVVGVAAVVAVGLMLRQGARERLAVGSTRQLTTDAGLYLDPALSPDGKFVAYAAGPSARMHLFVRPVDGARATGLTDSMPGSQRWPRWAPDGKSLAFQGDSGIYTVPALGGPAKLLVAGAPDAPPQSPAWSPDGARLAFAVGSTIRVLDVATGRSSALADLTQAGISGPAFELAWSPNGRWVAAATNNIRFAFGSQLGNIAPSRIVIVAADGGKVIPLNANVSAMEVSPVFDPDGRHLFFVSTRDGGRDVYEQPLRGSMEPDGDPIRLTTGLNAHSISLSPDGESLAYSSYVPSANIWSMAIPASGTATSAQARQITSGTDLIEAIQVSHDGQWLLFNSNRNGNSDIFRMPIAGGAAIQITSDSADEFGATWSPDDREIAFFSRVAGRVMVETVRTAGGDRPHVVDSLNGGLPDWSADGQELVYELKLPSPALGIATRQGEGWSAPTPIPGTAGGSRAVWSPDGRAIAFITADNSLAVVPPDGGPVRIVVRAGASPDAPLPDRAIWSPDSRLLYFHADRRDGTSAIWAVPASGGAPRPVVVFDDPALQMSSVVRFGTDGSRFYVRLIRQQSTLGVAALTRH
jgi:serine/threonine-protein kinase